MNRQAKIPLPLLKIISLLVLKTGFSFEIHGHRQLPAGPIILAGNHTGYLDSLVLLASVDRPFQFLMSDTVFTWGLIGKLVRYGNILPLNSDSPRHSLRQALKALKEGTSLCIFPEGKLSTNGDIGCFNEGVAYLQQKCGASIVPFAICGGFEAWPYGQKWPCFRKIIIRFGAPIEHTHGFSRPEVTQILKNRISTLYQKV